MAGISCNNRSEKIGVPYVPSLPYCLHAKETLEGFKVIRHTMTCLSIIIALLCTYIVIMSRSLTKAYSYMLVLLLLVWTSLDVLMQWVIDPVFLFPELLLYRRSPLLNIPITAGASMALLQCLLMFALVVYMAMFMYRHQVLVAVGSRLKLPVKAQLTFLAALSVPYLACGVEFYVVCFPAIPLYQKWLAQEFFNAEMIADRVDFYNVDRVWYMTLICDGHFVWMFVSAIARHTFILLRNIKNMSAKSQNLHRILVRSLIVQILTPLVFLILPLTVVLLTHVFVINQYSAQINDLKIQPFDVLLVIVSFHATAHSVALIATTPAFRAKLVQMLPLIMRQKAEPHIPLTGSSSITAASAMSNLA